MSEPNISSPNTSTVVLKTIETRYGHIHLMQDTTRPKPTHEEREKLRDSLHELIARLLIEDSQEA